MKRTISLSITTVLLNGFTGVLLYGYSGGVGEKWLIFYQNFYPPKDIPVITRVFFDWVDYWWAMLLVIVILSFHPLVFSRGRYRYLCIPIAMVCLLCVWATPYLSLILGNSPIAP